jgi:hypothetical protein
MKTAMSASEKPIEIRLWKSNEFAVALSRGACLAAQRKKTAQRPSCISERSARAHGGSQN